MRLSLLTAVMLTLALSVGALAALQEDLPATVGPPKIDARQVREKEKNTRVTLKTELGDIVIKMLPADAPLTVANFLGLAEGTLPFRDAKTDEIVKRPYYAGLTFHRAIKGFMIQGGCPIGSGRGGPGYRFQDEPVKRKYARGIVAMANAGPNTNGSQFFIMHRETPLPPSYTIFGLVQDGMEVVDKIASAATQGELLSPQIKIETVTVSRD